MRWEDGPRSDNIEDRCGDGGGGGGGFSLPVGTGGLGIGTVLILCVIGYFTGIDPRILIGGAQVITGNGGSQYSRPSDDGQYSGNRQAQRPSGGQQAGSQQADNQPAGGSQQRRPSDQMGDFVSAVLGDTEAVWGEVLPAQKGIAYVPPRLVLYSGVTRSGCGQAQSAMGPFYCPVDRKVYLDMSFFNDMKRRLGGGGDFAYAYVIAHEIGHHVQNLLGILGKAHQAMQDGDEQQSNAISVRLELQADCFAGVWANHADQKFHILEQGDVDKALSTAAAIGDDRLQKQSQGYAVPDSFTHGTSQQRQQWLTAGLKSGKIDSCNTFAQR